MISLSLRDLKFIPDSSIQNAFPEAQLDSPVRGISIDTRILKPQEIFWAISGETSDGHWFVSEAEKKGAIAAVVEKNKSNRIPSLNIPLILVKDTLRSLQQFAAWHRKRFKIPLIAITGTNGKTTTKEMIAWILQTKYNVHKTIGNFNNHIGTPLSLLRLNSEHQISIIELGTNHPGEIAMLSALVKPTGALITNIGQGHLEFLSDLNGVAKEKISLFRSLPRGGTVFLNRDDKKISAARIRRENTQDYSLQNDVRAKVHGRITGLNNNGAGIWKLNKTTIHMQVPGIHNIQNALAASAVGLYFGINEKQIKESLEAYHAYDKRMQIIKNTHYLIINDSYNANPDSFKPALDTLYHLSKGNNKRRIVVMGDMLELGDKSDQIHLKLFLHLLEISVDAIFTLGERSTAAGEKIREKGYERVYTFNSHQELADNLKRYLKSGDVILLKGSRGMQMEKVLAHL